MSSTSNARDATEAREAQQLYSQCAQAVLDGRDSDCIARIDASQTPSSHVDVDDVFRYNAQGNVSGERLYWRALMCVQGRRSCTWPAARAAWRSCGTS